MGDMTLKRSGDVTLHGTVSRLVQQGHKKLLVDLAGVPYADSAGLGELVQAHSAAKSGGGSLKLFSVSKRVDDLLVLTALSTVMDRFENETQALASF